MSKTHTADGRRRSSMTHASRRYSCQFCDRTVYGNGGKVAHARAHVRAGQAVEWVKQYPDGSTGRVFLLPDDTRAGWFAEHNYHPEQPTGHHEQEQP